MATIIKKLVIYPEKMKKNLKIFGDLHKSQNILLKLVHKGVSRQMAYELIQSAAMKSLESNKRFEDILKGDSKIKHYINEGELKKLLISDNKIKNIERIFKKAFED